MLISTILGGIVLLMELYWSCCFDHVYCIGIDIRHKRLVLFICAGIGLSKKPGARSGSGMAQESMYQLSNLYQSGNYPSNLKSW